VSELIPRLEALKVAADEVLVIRIVPDDANPELIEQLLVALNDVGLQRRALVITSDPSQMEFLLVKAEDAREDVTPA
jgi:hypothetical protein